MNFQRFNGLKLENGYAAADPLDGAVSGLLVSEGGRLSEAALISAIWGPPQVPQSRRLIKAINERKH